jgi:hypothetical protein
MSAEKKDINTPENTSENIAQEEVTENVKREVTQESTATPENKVTVLSASDSEIAGLAQSQPALDKMEALYATTQGRVDLLALPDECVGLHKREFRFKWMAKDKNLSAKLQAGPWILCTRTTTPFIKEHRFGTHGAVEQAGMLLAFTTEKLARIKEQIGEQRSKALLKHYTEDITDKEGFYKPKDSGSDEHDDGAYVEGRDF